jgi:hypothetical protein
MGAPAVVCPAGWSTGSQGTSDIGVSLPVSERVGGMTAQSLRPEPDRDGVGSVGIQARQRGVGDGRRTVRGVAGIWDGLAAGFRNRLAMVIQGDGDTLPSSDMQPRPAVHPWGGRPADLGRGYFGRRWTRNVSEVGFSFPRSRLELLWRYEYLVGSAISSRGC